MLDPLFERLDHGHLAIAWAFTALGWALDRWHVNRRAPGSGEVRLKLDRIAAGAAGDETPSASARLAALEDDLREHVAATASALHDRLEAVEAAGPQLRTQLGTRFAVLEEELRARLEAAELRIQDGEETLSRHGADNASDRLGAVEAGLATARASGKTILDAQSHYDRRLKALEGRADLLDVKLGHVRDECAQGGDNERALDGRIAALEAGREAAEADRAALETAVAQAGAELMRLYEAGSYATWRRDREQALEEGEAWAAASAAAHAQDAGDAA